MKYRILLLLLLIVCSCSKQVAQEEKEMPDILVLVGHERCALDYGFMSSKVAQSPALDILAQMSTMFTEGYVHSNQYTENQRSFITGKTPRVYNQYVDSLHANELARMTFKSKMAMEKWKESRRFESIKHLETLPKKLLKKGYKNYYAGDQQAFNIKSSGFEAATTSPEKNNDEVYSNFISSKNTILQQLSSDEEPVFIYFAPPPFPTDQLEQFAAKYNDLDTTAEAKAYYALGSWYDSMFENFIRRFRESRGERELMVIYFQDSGLPASHDLSYRSPILFSFGDRLPANKKSKALLSVTSLMPSILELIDEEPSSDHLGSYVSVLNGTKDKVTNTIYGESEDRYWIRNHDIFFSTTKDFKNNELYELNTDKQCHDNMIDYHPAKTKRYMKELKELTK